MALLIKTKIYVQVGTERPTKLMLVMELLLFYKSIFYRACHSNICIIYYISITLTLSAAAPISNKPCKKAKQMRLDRRLAKLGDSASYSTKSLTQEKTLRDFLNTDSETNKHRLKVRCE